VKNSTLALRILETEPDLRGLYRARHAVTPSLRPHSALLNGSSPIGLRDARFRLPIGLRAQQSYDRQLRKEGMDEVLGRCWCRRSTEPRHFLKAPIAHQYTPMLPMPRKEFTMDGAEKLADTTSTLSANAVILSETPPRRSQG